MHPDDEEPGGRIDILDSTHLLSEPELHWIRVKGEQALSTLGATGEVRVRVLSDEGMAHAHETYSRVPGPTDVLTFDLRAPGAADLDADLLIGLEVARREALARGHAVRDEVLLYVIHGILHCLGHDDTADDSSARMHAEEDRVLEQIGVGARYAKEARP